jgi:hypothetical protein
VILDPIFIENIQIADARGDALLDDHIFSRQTGIVFLDLIGAASW